MVDAPATRHTHPGGMTLDACTAQCLEAAASGVTGSAHGQPCCPSTRALLGRLVTLGPPGGARQGARRRGGVGSDGTAPLRWFMPRHCRAPKAWAWAHSSDPGMPCLASS